LEGLSFVFAARVDMNRYRKTDAIATAVAARFAFNSSLSIFVQATGPTQDEMDHSRPTLALTDDLQASRPGPELRSIRIVYPPVIALRHAALSSTADAKP
jgi:hypothetical protein